jgi:hypothetical protein
MAFAQSGFIAARQMNHIMDGAKNPLGCLLNDNRRRKNADF